MTTNNLLYFSLTRLYNQCIYTHALIYHKLVLNCDILIKFRWVLTTQETSFGFFFFFLRNPLDLLMGYLMHTTQLSKTTLGLVMTFWIFFIQITKAKKHLVVII